MPAIDSVDFLQNAPAPGYSARDLRRMWVDTLGEGVADASAYYVTFSAGLTLNISAGEAYVRGNSTADQGIYRCNNYSQRQVVVAAQDATNPRLDQIVLQVRDAAEDAGANNDGQVTVITGTPTAGATLDNRSGAASLAVSSPSLILLADVLVPATGTALSGANIRDRRPFASQGHPPVISANRQQVLFRQPAIALGSTRWNGGFDASRQSALAMYLPHRIPATHVRWRYIQDATNIVGTGQSWNIAVCDASGRLIGQTGATAFAGAAGIAEKIVAPFSPALPAGYMFDAGWYYVWAGVSAIGATSQIWFTGYILDNNNLFNGVMPATQNLAFKSATGGTTFDVSNTILGMTDCYSDSGNTTFLSIPQIALSIG